MDIELLFKLIFDIFGCNVVDKFWIDKLGGKWNCIFLLGVVFNVIRLEFLWRLFGSGVCGMLVIDWGGICIFLLIFDWLIVDLLININLLFFIIFILVIIKM